VWEDAKKLLCSHPSLSSLSSLLLPAKALFLLPAES
jgi:hypothetical protein